MRFRVPFPVMHVDTGHNFPEVLAFRDAMVERVGARLVVASVEDDIESGAVDSDAAGIDAVIAEIAASRLTERGATRADDKLSEAAMEDRKREGYF